MSEDNRPERVDFLKAKDHMIKIKDIKAIKVKDQILKLYLDREFYFGFDCGSYEKAKIVMGTLTDIACKRDDADGVYRTCIFNLDSFLGEDE